jgi:hypothetical protein
MAVGYNKTVSKIKGNEVQIDEGSIIGRWTGNTYKRGKPI